jgi:hypothetical protein
MSQMRSVKSPELLNSVESATGLKRTWPTLIIKLEMLLIWCGCGRVHGLLLATMAGERKDGGVYVICQTAVGNFPDHDLHAI